MLLPDNIHPKYTVYYNGAMVLHALQKNKQITMLDLYQDVKQQSDISFSIFILCLDWLFLLDIAVINKKGEVMLCS